MVETSNKSCADCHTTRTPLWRGGPAGPRSLCNACGIRYRKQRRSSGHVGMKRDESRREKSRSRRKKSKNGGSFKLGEEEQAAILLMALSCGSFVYYAN